MIVKTSLSIALVFSLVACANAASEKTAQSDKKEAKGKSEPSDADHPEKTVDSGTETKTKTETETGTGTETDTATGSDDSKTCPAAYTVTKSIPATTHAKLDCGPSDRTCAQLQPVLGLAWQEKGTAPLLLASDLKDGDEIRLVSVGGNLNYAPNFPDPNYNRSVACNVGGTPTAPLYGVGLQFSDQTDATVDSIGFTNFENFVYAKDLPATFVKVPTGTKRIYGAVPDPDNSDNTGNCDVSIEVKPGC